MGTLLRNPSQELVLTPLRLFLRRWPGEIKMSSEVNSVVDRKGKELGL